MLGVTEVVYGTESDSIGVGIRSGIGVGVGRGSRDGAGGVSVLEADENMQDSSYSGPFDTEQPSNPFQEAADSFVIPGEPESTVTGDGDEPIDDGDIFDDTIDNEAVDRQIKNSLPPEGWYEAQGLSHTVFLTADLQGERRVYSHFGTAYREGQKTRVRFKICQTLTYKEKADGSRKEAWDYQCFKKARKAYKFVHGEYPRTMGELNDWLDSGIVRFRLIQTDDDTLVVEVSGVKV